MNELDEEKRIRLTLQVPEKQKLMQYHCMNELKSADKSMIATNELFNCVLFSDGNSAIEEAHVKVNGGQKFCALVDLTTEHCYPC